MAWSAPGLHGLVAERIASLRASGPDAVHHVHRDRLVHTGGRLDDDAAVLVIERSPPPAARYGPPWVATGSSTPADRSRPQAADSRCRPSVAVAPATACTWSAAPFRTTPARTTYFTTPTGTRPRSSPATKGTSWAPPCPGPNWPPQPETAYQAAAPTTPTPACCSHCQPLATTTCPTLLQPPWMRQPRKSRPPSMWVIPPLGLVYEALPVLSEDSGGSDPGGGSGGGCGGDAAPVDCR